MNYAKITYPDLNNGEGCRVSLWLSGCNFHCKNCFNSELWDFNYGTPFTSKTLDTLCEILSKPYIQGLSVLGGEPLEHTEELTKVLKVIKDRFPEKDIWLWTGYLYEEVASCEMEEILPYIDYLVDGLFIEELKDPSLKFRGSSNQRIIKINDN